MKKTLLIATMLLFVFSCSVISQRIRSESEPTITFEILLKEADKYRGKTVILGGYVLGISPEIKDLTGETIIEILQTPLMLGDEPKSRDHSKGRFIVRHKGILEPERYGKDRKITVAGKLMGFKDEGVKVCQLESREIYVWPEFDEMIPYDYLKKDSRDWYEHHNRVYDQGPDKIYQYLPRIEDVRIR